MRGLLDRGAFPRLAYRLGRGSATGELIIAEAPRRVHKLYLRRGYLCAAELEGNVAPLGRILVEAGAIDDDELAASLAASSAGDTLQGRELVRRGALSERDLDAALRRQAELRLERLAAIAGAPYAFEAGTGAPARSRGGRPVSLTAWARRHLEARLDSLRARELADRLAGARLALRKDLIPEVTDCDETDRRILDALTTPRRLDEIERSTHAPRLRLLAFLHFLRSVGALEAQGVAAAAGAGQTRARRLLGVDANADPEAIRRAYRRLAREWHPDMHPGAAASKRQMLEERFAALAEAYRLLTD